MKNHAIFTTCLLFLWDTFDKIVISSGAERRMPGEIRVIDPTAKGPERPAELVTAHFLREFKRFGAGPGMGCSGHGQSNRAYGTNLTGPGKSLSFLAAMDKSEFGTQHGCTHGINPKEPPKTTVDSHARAWNATVDSVMQKRRRHPMLMNRIHFVRIKNPRGPGQKKPWPKRGWSSCSRSTAKPTPAVMKKVPINDFVKFRIGSARQYGLESLGYPELKLLCHLRNDFFMREPSPLARTAAISISVSRKGAVPGIHAIPFASALRFVG